MSYLTSVQYEYARRLAKQARNLERVRIGIEHQINRMSVDENGEATGFPASFYPWSEAAMAELGRLERSIKDKYLSGHYEGSVLAEWIDGTPGLGKALYFILGLVPPLALIEGVEIPPFANVAKLWRYCGLHPEGGQRKERGVFRGYSSFLKAATVHRVAEPCMKQRASPYRAVYDRRREHTLVTHPPMLAEGEGCDVCDLAYSDTKAHRAGRNLSRERKAPATDCAALGGIHWTDGHRMADSLRVTAKAVMRDAWRVANGMGPREGHPGHDAHLSDALSEPVHA